MTRSALCEDEGIKTRVCALCGIAQTETIPALGHKPLFTDPIQPTCTSSGKTAGEYCGICNKVLKEEEILLPLGHSDLYTVGAREATDTENGYTGDLYCGVCNELLEKGSDVPAKGHGELVLINDLPATCTGKGYTGDWYCEECGVIVAYGSEIPPLNHVYSVERTVLPDCENGGYSILRCAECGATERSKETQPLGHEQGADGYCVRCGKSLFDRSGDFGALHFDKFLSKEQDTAVFETDAEIRAYLISNGLPITSKAGAEYLSLYRSRDLFVSLYSFYEKSDGYLAKYCVYDVYIRNLKNLYTVNERSGKLMTDLIAEGERTTGGRAVVAVNGDYFSNSKVCRTVVRNGRVLRDPENVICDVCVMFRDGSIKTYKPSQYDYESIMSKGVYQIWNFGPALLDENGNVFTEFNESVYSDRIISNVHPRTALGYSEPGHYTVVIVDGRQTDDNGIKIYGCTVRKLARIMKELGCVVAYNLDGGDSSQAYMNGKVVRIDKTRDPQRVLSDAILIGEVP